MADMGMDMAKERRDSTGVSIGISPRIARNPPSFTGEHRKDDPIKSTIAYLLWSEQIRIRWAVDNREIPVQDGGCWTSRLPDGSGGEGGPEGSDGNEAANFF